MKRTLLLLLTVLAMSSAQAQEIYVGLNLNLLTNAGLIAGVQAGGAATEQFGLRGTFASNFDTLLISAEGFYKPSPADAVWQGYIGGGLTLISSSSFFGPETSTLILPILTGGYEYRIGALGMFGKLGLLVYIPSPAPELRTGISLHFVGLPKPLLLCSKAC